VPQLAATAPTRRPERVLPPRRRGLKIAGLAIGLIWPVVGVADAVSLGHHAWAAVIAAVTGTVVLLAWRFPGVGGALLVLAAIFLVPVAVWAVGFGLGMAEKTANLDDYLRALVLVPGPFLLAGVLLLVASRRSDAELVPVKNDAPRRSKGAVLVNAPEPHGPAMWAKCSHPRSARASVVSRISSRRGEAGP
jgi:hypothetical protein